jgi:hypothetical protein
MVSVAVLANSGIPKDAQDVNLSKNETNKAVFHVGDVVSESKARTSSLELSHSLLMSLYRKNPSESMSCPF